MKKIPIVPKMIFYHNLSILIKIRHLPFETLGYDKDNLEFSRHLFVFTNDEVAVLDF